MFRAAMRADHRALGRLRCEWAGAPEEEEFLQAFEEWLLAHAATHQPFVALDGDEPVGMATLALLSRVPDVGQLSRLSADLQSVYVRPAHRGRGIGQGLVLAVLRHAWELGVERVTVSSSGKAVTLYERAGFVSSRRLLEIRASDIPSL